ncbi:splicing factor, partial [Exophiala xenobiotica]
MAAEQRKLLEQLMGEQFMGGGSSRSANLTLASPNVCRSYLVGTCPHDLFTNTKQDLGPCPKPHPEHLKIEYDGLSPAEKQKYGYEYDYLRDMQ